MCTVLLPPGGNPIAVDKYIISYHILGYEDPNGYTDSRSEKVTFVNTFMNIRFP